MPKKNNNLNQYVKELEEYKDRVLNMFGSQVNENTLQAFIEMEKEIRKNRKK
jgi:hypothetical protein